MITRRDLVLAGAAACAPIAACAVLEPAVQAGGRLPETRIGDTHLTLTAGERATRLMPDTKPAQTWLYDTKPFPVLRLKKGEALNVTLANALREHTSIHWHGVRGPNAMDGVPYLTQLPVQPGKTFDYRFVPPDAGTFFFHPHCNTAEQLGRGLVGALIVEEPDAAFDDDIVVMLKDWRLDEAGNFLPFVTASGASRAGSFGTLRTANGLPAPRIATRGRDHIRLRVINVDSTRILQFGIEGAEATIIAIDGVAVEPFAPDGWRLGPAMRLDLALKATGANDIRLIDYFSSAPVVLATLVPSNANASGSAPSLVPSAQPDFMGASRHTLDLGAGVDVSTPPDPPPIVLPDGSRIDLADSLCLGTGTFWTLDGQSWPDRDHRKLPPPLFDFRRGEKVVLDLVNSTSRAHPIHIHGHTMTVLSASLLQRPVHRADTVLVLPNERVSLGFIADNPGNWMIHCHIIEHQETGMMGWFRVS